MEVQELVKQFRRGPYLIRHEMIYMGSSKPMLMKSAYNLKGDLIGETKEAHHLWKKFGIEMFEKIDSMSGVCSIGYSPKRKKWYGWSHRAINGFKSKKRAINFARSVS